MKARIENGKIKKYSQLPEYYKHWAGGFREEPTSVHEAEGFFDVVEPVIDYELQKRGDIYWDESNSVFTYPVIDKTAEELAQEVSNKLDSLDSDIDFSAVKRILQKIVEPILTDEQNLTEQDIIDATTLYKQWRVDIVYSIGDKFIYDSQLYKVVQAHTSQSDWLPNSTPALYTKYVPAGVIAPWVQPTGAQDAYMIGDKVSFEGSNYESVIDNNVWSPTIYPAGWTLLG
jgi:hypothetical protein